MAVVRNPCKIIKTPNPCELGLRVEVKDSMLAAHPEIFPGQTGIIPYKDFNARSSSLLKLNQAYLTGFGDFVYSTCEEGKDVDDQGIGSIYLYFSKAKTDAQRNTPFKSWFTKKSFTFDAVVSGIMILRDTQITDKPRYFPKYFGLAEYTGPCLFKIEQFLSEVPWNQNSFQSTAPQPGDIDATIMFPTGLLQIRKSRVLHPDLSIRNPFPNHTSVFYKTGFIPKVNGNTTEFVFPSTNPGGRLPYIQTDSQDPVQGQWLRERVTIYPPFISRPLDS